MYDAALIDVAAMIKEHMRTILETPLSALIFSTQERLEAQPQGMDWQRAFREVMEAVFRTMAVPPPSSLAMEDASCRFIEHLCACPMDDLVYADVPEVLNGLCAAAGEIVLWSQGDVVNNHQTNKIEASGVRALLRRAQQEYGVRLSEIIVAKKIDVTLSHIGTCFEASKRPERVAFSVIDDAPENLLAFDVVAHTWASEMQTTCETVLIRARCGRRANEPTPETGGITIHEVRSLTEAVSVLGREIKARQIDAQSNTLFLDFDGVLTDNEAMRNRYVALMHRSVRELFCDVALQEKFDEHFLYT